MLKNLKRKAKVTSIENVCRKVGILIKDSFLFWYPKVKDLPIPQPKTEIVLLTKKELRVLYCERVCESVVEKVRMACERLGYPCFLRTDLASAKHSWKHSCFIDGCKGLEEHILNIVSFNLCAGIMGLDFKAFVVREFIPMDTRFTAFHGDTPINPERRYFIKNGRVLCHHPYWIEDAIEQVERIKSPSIQNWREVLKEINTETKEEIALLTNYAEIVAKQFDGYWSIDFCRAKDGRWILVDMATGERSWHPKCDKVG
jgi:hypothetical protein